MYCFLNLPMGLRSVVLVSVTISSLAAELESPSYRDHRAYGIVRFSSKWETFDKCSGILGTMWARYCLQLQYIGSAWDIMAYCPFPLELA